MTEKRKNGINVPNLRFPGFEGEWEETSLGTCSESLDYGMNSAATKYDGENRYIRITDIDEASSTYKSDSPVSPDGNLSDKYLLTEGDILFARTGASTGKTYLYNSKDGKIYFAGFLIRARIKEIFNPYFIFKQTQTIKYNAWVKLMSMRSGQPGINSQEYASYSFKIPTRLEQNKIASLILLIDTGIQTQNKIIKQLETSMQNLRESLFTQKVRFKDNFGKSFADWETKKLEDIASRIVNKNKENNKNVLTISAQHGLINQLDFFNKSVSAKDLTGYFLLNQNDFAYNKSYSNGYPMGAIKRLKYYKKGIVSTLYICFNFRSNVDLDFIEHFFESGVQNLELEKIAQEGARNHGLLNIGLTDFFNIKLSLPSLEEQNQIGKFLYKFKEKINLEKQLLLEYENQKKYLLQNLFI